MSSSSAPRRLIVEDNGRSTVFFVPDEPVIIGRGDRAALILADQQISKNHCELRIDDDELVLKDLGSTNGTFVNDNRVYLCSLRPGDVVRIGDAVLRVAPDEAGASAPPAAARALAPPAPVRLDPAAAATIAPGPDSTETRIPRNPRRHHGGGSAARWIAAAVVLIAVGAGGYAWLNQGRGDAALPPIKPKIPLSAVRDDSAPPTVAPPPSSETDKLLRAFDAALTREDWAVAQDLLARAGSPADAAARLALRLDGIEQNSKARFVELQRTDGQEAATTWLRGVIATLPASLPLRARLEAFAAGAPVPGTPGSDPATEYTASRRTVTPTAPPSPTAPETKPAPRPPEAKGGAPAPHEDTPSPMLADARKEATKLIDGGDLEQGIIAAKALIDAAQKAGAKTTQADAERLLRLAETEARVRALIVRKVPQGLPTGRDIPHLPGERGKLLGANAEGATFGGAQGQVMLKWRVLPAHSLLGILQQLELEPTEMVDAAVAMLRRDRTPDADAFLNKAAKTPSPELTAAINRSLADARGMLDVPGDGFHQVGEHWLSPQEWARHVAADTVARSTKDLSSPDPAVRRKAFEEMLKIGDAGKAPLHRALLVRRAELMEDLEKKNAVYAKLVELAAERTKLDELRDQALSIIDDDTKYPYPYRPPEATAEQFQAYARSQKAIDAIVPLIRKAWESKTSVHINAPFRQKLAELDEVAKWAQQLAVAPVDPLPGWIGALPPTDEVTILNVAISAADRERIDRSVKVMAENVADPAGANRGEQDEARITNDYRVMMGRWALRVYAPLTLCARGHCDDMARLGFFAHESPVEGKKTPMDRARLTGMEPSGISENIAQSSGPQGAHNGWCHSSGHHRNLLSPGWRLFGVGNNGGLWCQNFAVADAKTEKNGSPESR